jgi:hypothetical protein
MTTASRNPGKPSPRSPRGIMAQTRRPQPPERPKRYRKPGSLAQLKGMLWETLLTLSGMVEDPTAGEDRKLKASHAMAQLAGAYLKTVEVHDLAAQVAALQEAVNQRRR